MRKLVSAFILAAVATAHADQSRGLVLANADASAQAQPAVAPAQGEARPAQSQAQAQRVESPRQQASRPATRSRVRRHESDEAKARPIDARYGVYGNRTFIVAATA
ncbi:pyruvate/2-oxoglutarate dehydrogenase complex dihydrolipoamide acyltransferase (E2) component [Bradyrhizobium japonicum]|uniref:Pyruvate/2-oxoglutarate dehydrogenase complex dihydrolipoamide acyltransferase (E2) component n=1 Tax=Bradyrhizobium elkanii TaxID=29448 RepID=A0ABV4ES88_BRAEL|nr:hypothetical protein [Bradyrhizobium elkanii]MBP2429547.1 pyruvate/2-oxoglutarate dehydrogenase complex dihydrolipoamide acyltransferase (E2) component [Bradyrhizobium elkanii]MCP1736981.1 pyruvate/2-oxoglutarate dehydrogenase complex dihydrolipoamide acyltransferase (E2) component [Bradyrhizobium elkanii]MCP1755026.1 pyruvate/2-oxoglutarate dehydrogenase complex dihydrolipoamide acyltransferase (E2) component [Bradyrhizobium elkanii]MCP1972834.1 pyruvate/2-oxoglutarate dehydrogenase complex